MLAFCVYQSKLYTDVGVQIAIRANAELAAVKTLARASFLRTGHGPLLVTLYSKFLGPHPSKFIPCARPDEHC